MRGIDFACPDIYIKSFSYGQERTANAASGRTRSGIRSDDDAGEGQLPGRLQRQMGDSFQPPCRFHAYLHLGGAYFRRPHCGVQGAELRADRSFGGQPQQPYRVAAHDPRKDRIQGHEGYKGGIYCIDARKVSEEALGRYFPNTPMLAAIVKVANIMDEKDFLNDMKGSFKHKFAKKPEVIEGNMKALEMALNEVKKIN